MPRLRKRTLPTLPIRLRGFSRPERLATKESYRQHHTLLTTGTNVVRTHGIFVELHVWRKEAVDSRIDHRAGAECGSDTETQHIGTGRQRRADRTHL